jgi:hypothetical protein
VIKVDGSVKGTPGRRVVEQGEVRIGDILCAVNGRKVLGWSLGNVTALFRVAAVEHDKDKQGEKALTFAVTFLRQANPSVVPNGQVE